LHNFVLGLESVDESEVEMEEASVECEDDARDVVSGADKRRDIIAMLA
jgi:hypothetical protein